MRAKLFLAAAAAAVAVSGCSDRSEPAAPTTTVPKVRYVGDQPVKPEPAEVSAECAATLVDARKVIADNDYFTDLDLEGVHTIKVALENRDDACTTEEAAAFAEEVAAWRSPIPPTYAQDPYAELSAQCAEAMEGPRAKLRAVPDGAAGPELAAAIDEANAALEGCSPVERELFTAVEILPVQRRAGTLPASSDDEPVALPEPHTVQRTDRAELSARCADAAAPARALLAERVGEQVTETLVDEVSSAVAAAAPHCTTEELDTFQGTEVAPALGMFHPG